MRYHRISFTFPFLTVVRFVGDRQRMNVALTRARHALYVFGHMETLKVTVSFGTCCNYVLLTVLMYFMFHLNVKLEVRSRAKKNGPGEICSLKA